MKKIAGRIAMILILILLANSFTGCLTGLAIRNADFPGSLLLIPLAFAGDLLIIALIGALVFSAELPDETGIYLANAECNPLTDYNWLMEKLNSLPEMEGVSLMDKINSVPETKRAFLLMIINYLPETEIASSIKRLNTLSEAELASVVRAFNSLSESELDSLADSLSERIYFLPSAEYAAAAGHSRNKTHIDNIH